MSRINKKSLLCPGLVIAFFLSISWASEFVDFRSKAISMPAGTIKKVLKEHAQELISLPGVVGVGQGLCDRAPCIKVFVIKKSPELEQKIPHSLGDYPVVIEETGKIKALPGKQN